jgi:hypothetical protein
MPEKVTKDEKIAELLKKAAEKTLAALSMDGEYDGFNQDSYDTIESDLAGKEVKLRRPKALNGDKYSSGSDEEKTKIRDVIEG